MENNIEEALKSIIELTMDQFVMEHETSAHGIKHWQEVEKNGIMLAIQPGVS